MKDLLFAALATAPAFAHRIVAGNAVATRYQQTGAR